MSVREEEGRKNNCSTGRGVGLAAAAIGVGVGAALYYFFNKRAEGPASEGSTSRDWEVDGPQTLDITTDSIKSEYTTISVNSTTDTSIHDSIADFTLLSDDTEEDRFPNRSMTDFNESYDSKFTIPDSDDSEIIISDSDVEDNEVSEIESIDSSGEESETEDEDEYDITESSEGIPSDNDFFAPFSPIIVRENAEEEQIRLARERNFRERKWSLEECAICFDIMLKDHQLMTLPCTHHFHVQCIGPWLQEHQTCPVCRKAAE